MRSAVSQQAEKAKGVAWTPLLQLWKAGVSAWQDSSHLVGREDTGEGGRELPVQRKNRWLVLLCRQVCMFFLDPLLRFLGDP